MFKTLITIYFILITVMFDSTIAEQIRQKKSDTGHENVSVTKIIHITSQL